MNMLKLIAGIMIGIPALMLLLFTVQNYLGSMDELETSAANMFLVVTGLPALLMVGVSSLLIRSYINGTKNATPGSNMRYCHACGTQMAIGETLCAQCGTEQP